MSISTLQEKFFNKGCGSAILVCLGAVMVAGMLYQGSCKSVSNQSKGERRQTTIAVVNGVDVHAEEVERAYESGMQRMGMTVGIPPEMEAQFLGSAVIQTTNQALVVKLAQEQGAKFDDAELRAVMNQQFDEAIPRVRMQMIQQGALKDGATDVEFDAAIKKQTGKTLAELRAESAIKVDEALKDPAQRSVMISGAAEVLLERGVKAKLQTSEEALKATYNTYMYKRILLRKDQSGETPAARAAKVLAELKAKTSTFEQAMDRYSGDLPEPGKKLSQVGARSASNAMAESEPDLAALTKLKAGEISEEIESPEGTIIFQLVSIRSDVPKDYEQNKAKYRSQYLSGASKMEVEKKLTEAQKTIKIEWKSSAFKALYDWVKLMQEPAGDPAKREAGLLAIVKDAEKSREEAGLGADVRASVLAQYGAFTTLWRGATPEKKKALIDDRIKALEAMLSITESVDLHLELASVYVEKNDGENAFGQVLQAAQANNTTDQSGESNDRNISGRLIQLKLKKLISPEQESAIVKEQTRWRNDRDDAKKNELEQKKQEAEQKKAFDAEQKKAAAAQPKGPAPKSPSTTPAPPTGTGGSFLPKSTAGN